MSLFSRKQYVWLASVARDVLHEAQTIETTPGATLAIYKIADALEEENPRFDRERFLNAIYADPTTAAVGG